MKAANEAREKDLKKLQEQLNAAVEAKAAAEARAKELQDLKDQLKSAVEERSVVEMQSAAESLHAAATDSRVMHEDVSAASAWHHAIAICLLRVPPFLACSSRLMPPLCAPPPHRRRPATTAGKGG